MHLDKEEEENKEYMSETHEQPQPIPGSSLENPFCFLLNSQESLATSLFDSYDDIQKHLETLGNSVIYIDVGVGVLKADFSDPKWVSTNLETFTHNQDRMTEE